MRLVPCWDSGYLEPYTSYEVVPCTNSPRQQWLSDVGERTIDFDAGSDRPSTEYCSLTAPQ